MTRSTLPVPRDMKGNPRPEQVIVYCRGREVWARQTTPGKFRCLGCGADVTNRICW